MNVYLSFDIEVWCNGWNDLDGSFPACFDRYVYGRSRHGDYALPQTLAMLNRHGLKGVFFVEPLFAARFGMAPLATIVRLIRDAGHEVQLHLHPEWTDEAVEPIIADCAAKRQHLSYYTLEEQTALIGWGRRALEDAGSGPVSAFRAGSFAADLRTFEALRHNGILLDSSLNRCYDVSLSDLDAGRRGADLPFEASGIHEFPVAVFRDGLRRERPAQVNGCAVVELIQALDSAHAAGWSDFVIVSHNFEMLRPGRSEPDWFVVRRFEALCRALAASPERFSVGGFARCAGRTAAAPRAVAAPSARLGATAWRYTEQLARRFVR